MIWLVILCVTPFAVLAGIILAEVALLLHEIAEHVRTADRRNQK